MLVKSKDSSFVPSSEITPKNLYVNRREVPSERWNCWRSGGGRRTTGRTGLPGFSRVRVRFNAPPARSMASEKVYSAPPRTELAQKTFRTTTTTTNSPRQVRASNLAKKLQDATWTITVDGAVKKKKTWDIDEFLKLAPPEERIYRHRCVGGWSWLCRGSGSDQRADPAGRSLPKAKFLEFSVNRRPASRCRDTGGRSGLALHEGAHG